VVFAETIALCCTDWAVRYGSVRSTEYGVRNGTVQYCTVQYCTCGTVQYVHYSTVLYSGVQYCRRTVQYSSTVRTVQSPVRNPQMRKNEAGRARPHAGRCTAQQRPRKRSTVRHPGAGRIGKEGEKGPALWENRTVSGHYISFCNYFIKLPLFYGKMRDNFRRLRARGNASRAIVNRVALRGFRGNGSSRRLHIALYCAVLYGMVLHVTIRRLPNWQERGRKPGPFGIMGLFQAISSQFVLIL